MGSTAIVDALVVGKLVVSKFRISTVGEGMLPEVIVVVIGFVVVF